MILNYMSIFRAQKIAYSLHFVSYTYRNYTYRKFIPSKTTKIIKC